ncbi:RICIN domain-containing protein [Flavivirga algicola]|uniref:T9SS type A sorting domain-containing protein n=1 Tax=Flavivirga algicola TaxID=2729136 RepID=A0ABX1S460_9FLAO|nr:RICIN domain-containing protein [Flavivirga algicola]NMH89833.1 T9SS type A sorting domain-containing protein [Flavivirga algicola]
MKTKLTRLLSCFLVVLMFNFLHGQRWEDNFNSPNFKNNYDFTAGHNFKHLTSGGYNNSPCVEIKINKGQHYGGSMRYLLKQKWGFEPEEVYAEYRVRYDASMGNQSAGYGGKAPGFSGTYDEAGWGNRPGYGVEGWSARGTINCDNQNYVQNRYYLYHTYTNYDAPVRTGSTDYRNYNPKAYSVSNPGAQPHASTKTFASALNWGSWSRRDASDMDFNRWYHVKQYVKMNDVGRNNGILRAWVNGVQVCNVTNINFRRVEKLKVYAYWFNYYNGGRDVADGDAYVRIDDFKIYVPNGNGGGSGGSTFIHMKKRNASGYALDGGNGGANNQNVKLWASNTNNQNQQWEEISRGNGYYSYKKRNTNFCLDGGNGGSNGQNLKLWTCSSSNQNQHWKKISAGSGHFRLQKRNASNYSIDGGNGGSNNQSAKLWRSSASNQNQQWKFTTVSSASSKSSIKKTAPEEEVKLNNASIFPNPFTSSIALSLGDKHGYNAANLYSITSGKTLFSKTLDVSKKDYELSLENLNLAPGFYLLKLSGQQKEAKTFKLIKK